jgi:hypothetical protein
MLSVSNLPLASPLVYGLKKVNANRNRSSSSNPNTEHQHNQQSKRAKSRSKIQKPKTKIQDPTRGCCICIYTHLLGLKFSSKQQATTPSFELPFTFRAVK